MLFLTSKPAAWVCAGALMLAGGLWPLGALAQNPFAPAARIDSGVITQFQLDQRLAFLTLLNAPGTDRAAVLDTLIDEHLQIQAARAAGIEITETDIQEGITEFASRANMTGEVFLRNVGTEGIAPETVRDFVANGLAWRNLVQSRFQGQARPSPEEIDRAMALTSGPGAVRVLLSEIALPLQPPFEEQARTLAEDLARTLRTPAQFADAARQFSASPTGPSGGGLDWMALSALPPAVSAEVLVAAPGEILGPINMGGYLALFLMRALDETAPKPAETLALDYAEVTIAGGRSPETLAVAQLLRSRTDTCDDLYGTTQGLPVSPPERRVAPARDLPRDVALEMAKLDDNEVSTLLLRADGALRYLMLCGRTAELAEGEREAVAQRLFAQRLESYADGYLDELRAQARIRKTDG